MGDRDKTYEWCPKRNHGVWPEDVNGAGKHKHLVGGCGTHDKRQKTRNYRELKGYFN